MNENGRQGRLTDEQKLSIKEVVAGFPDTLRTVLEAPFEPVDVKRGEQRPDGFIPTYIEAATTIRRLNDCFGSNWDFKITDYEFLWNVGQVIAVVSMTAKWYQRGPDNIMRLLDSTRSGTGTASLRQVNGQFICPGDDLKMAVTDGIKVTARLFGVALMLWENHVTAPATVTQAAVQQPPAPTGAAPFQLDAIISYFEGKCKIPRQDWMHGLQIVDMKQITAEFGQYVLSGQHPYAAHIIQQTGQPIQGLRASAAR